MRWIISDMSTTSIPETARVWACAECATAADEWVATLMTPRNLAEAWLLAGRVSLDRIIAEPPPGSATVEDAVESKARFGVGCELVNGILVAKSMGYYESHLATLLIHFLYEYLDKHPIGILTGEEGPYLLLPENVRKPDVAFLSFSRLPDGKLPRTGACPIAPDLAIEVLAPSNTKGEMDLKLKQYFKSGVRLVWHIESELRTARTFTAVDDWEDLGPEGILRGGDVLPGFELPLTKLFEKAGPRIEQ
jgi:Uma2 family endonuclease